jgi:hypothetical protein
MTRRIEELNHRETNGISVALLWNRRTNALYVRVHDSTNGKEFEVACAPNEALDT